MITIVEAKPVKRIFIEWDGLEWCAAVIDPETAAGQLTTVQALHQARIIKDAIDRRQDALQLLARFAAMHHEMGDFATDAYRDLVQQARALIERG